MLAPFASEQLVVLLLDRCHCRLEGLLVEANPDQHSEVGRVEVGVCQQPSAREDLLDVGLVRQVARSLLEENVVFSSAVMRPSQNDPRNLTCVPIRFIGCRSSLYFCTSSRGWAFFLFGGICEALEQRQRSVESQGARFGT